MNSVKVFFEGSLYINLESSIQQKLEKKLGEGHVLEIETTSSNLVIQIKSKLAPAAILVLVESLDLEFVKIRHVIIFYGDYYVCV